MISTVKKWLSKSKPSATSENGSSSQATSNETVQASLNQGTYVSVQELIQLQAQARKLDLSQRSFAKASTTGRHHSRFRGRGMDYQESRIYQAGDDIRSMDWRVTARAGKPHTKLYQEERERPVMLLLDLSPSMFFGSKKMFKSVLAAKVAALLGWAATLKGDRVGALLIGHTKQKADQNSHLDHKELAPKSGKRGALQLIRELVNQVDPHHLFADENNLAQTENDFNDELQRLRRITRPGSLIFILSDFYNINEKTVNHLIRLSHHNDIIAIQIIDPLEQNAPPAGRYGVTNGEITGMLNTRSKKRRNAYNDYFSEHHKAVERLMTRTKTPLLKISTTDDPANALQQVFGHARQRQSILSKVA